MSSPQTSLIGGLSFAWQLPNDFSVKDKEIITSNHYLPFLDVYSCIHSSLLQVWVG